MLKLLLTKKLLLLVALLNFYQAHPSMIPKEPLKLGAIQMQTSYKFWYIKRDDDGFIIEATVRFYEGETLAKDELKMDINGNLATTSIIRYRRSRRLQEADLPKTKIIKKELSGNDVVLYTPKDFGQIKTDNELRNFLNSELMKDNLRTPIPEQVNK